MEKRPKLEDFLLRERGSMDTEKKAVESKPNKSKYGIGFDIGTGFLVSSYFEGSDLKYKSIRNCFVTIDKKLFRPSLFGNTVSYIDRGDDIVIVGDDAMEFAKIRNTAAQRPIASGIINPNERESVSILKEIFSHMIKPCIKTLNEKLVFSVPGKNIGNPDFDVSYHTMSLQSLCKSFGVEAEPINEAYAVAISEIGGSTSPLTALSFSFGAGLVNICLTYKGIPLFEFCIDKSGDFIDKQAAKGVGESESVMCHIKEKELDLAASEYKVSPEERALMFSYKFVVRNTLLEVKHAFTQTKNVRILEEIPIILSGGTITVKGFLDLFKSELEATPLPFKVGSITFAKEPLRAVARGCLLDASSRYNEESS